ncbi:MAG: PEGA domain-containing protein, partial [Deltaproteobacteria bacterium]|nr:PEGA domain-containing protein [Deltaproteobacteria bacterium]
RTTPAPRGTPAAVAESEPPAPPADSRPLLWGGAVGLFAIVIGGGIWAVVSGNDGAPPNTLTTSTTSPPTTTSPPLTTATPLETSVPPTTTDPPPTAPPPTVAAAITVSLGSDPMGAEVFSGETRLCTTPCLFDLPAGNETSLTFRRDGYLDTIERLTPAEGAAVSPRLRPRRRTVSDGTTGVGGGPAIKTTL